MPKHDPRDADCRVFTFKEGLLSAVAHDLEIDVTRFSIDVSEDGLSIHATFDASSLRVLDAVVDGRRAPGALGDKDKRKIESTIVSDVLSAKKHPEIRFESTEVTDTRIRGRLTIAGRSREVSLTRDGDSARVTVHQPDFGIKPYSAMLGTLKIKAEVEVRISLRR